MIHYMIPIVLASINAELRPAGNGDVDLVLIGDGQQLVASCEIVVQYDPTTISLTGATNDPDAPLMDFFAAFPDFLPCNFAIDDGDAMFIGLVTLGQDFAPSPDGTRIATLRFDGCGPVSIPATLLCGEGEQESVTVVWDGVIPNLPVTGTLTGADSCDVVPRSFGVVDMLVLLGAWMP